MEIIQKNNTEGGRFIAQEDGHQMGYISYEWFEPKVLRLMHTVVRPEYRGHGVAKALLDATVQYARTNGILIHAVCSYAVKEISKSEYDDVNKCKH